MKLQIVCVVEDDKVGTDFLEDKICAFEDYVSLKLFTLLRSIIVSYDDYCKIYNVGAKPDLFFKVAYFLTPLRHSKTS